jgi:hypothetical protein
MSTRHSNRARAWFASSRGTSRSGGESHEWLCSDGCQNADVAPGRSQALLPREFFRWWLVAERTASAGWRPPLTPGDAAERISGSIPILPFGRVTLGAGLDSRCASGHHAAMSKELELFHWWFHDDITGQRCRTPFAMDRETATQLYGSVQADEPTRVLRTISEPGEARHEQMLPQFPLVEGGTGPSTAPRH